MNISKSNQGGGGSGVTKIICSTAGYEKQLSQVATNKVNLF